MSTNYTYTQIANDYNLWLDLVDIDGNMSRETFDATPESELVAMMTDMFGAERSETESVPLAISVYKNGRWAATFRPGKNGKRNVLTILADKNMNDDLYAMIDEMVERGETDGGIEIDGHVYTWYID